MPVYEKTTGGKVYLRGIDQRVSAGDRVDVDDGFGEYLEGRGDFRAVDGGSETADSDESSSEGFDIDTWLDADYDERADRVRSGEVDEHLETIDEAETSGTVRDAIGERRAELEV